MSNQVDHASRGHHEMGPSSLKYIASCRGWKSRGGTNPAAEKGTRIHEAVEMRDFSGLHDESEVAIYDQLVEGEERWIQTVFGDSPVEIHREVPLDMELPYQSSNFGTSDLVVVSGDTCLNLDHKTGIGEIDEVEDNWQAFNYAIGVFQRWPEVRVIHSVFLIPQRGQELHGTFTRDQLEELEDKVATVILEGKITRLRWEKGQPPLEELNPNNGCTYCAFADRCPALGHIALEIAAKYEPEWLPEGPIRSSEVEDPETLGKLYTIASIVEKWAEGIKRKGVLAALDGIPPTGFKIRSMGCTRKVTSPADFLNVAEKLGMNPKEILALADFPVAKVRDLYSSTAKRGQKTAYAEQFEEAMVASGAVEIGSERVTLTKE